MRLSTLVSLAAFAGTVYAGILIWQADRARTLNDELQCGAAGDMCRPSEWKAYNLAASEHFREWPEVAFRFYADGCAAGSAALKRLCLTKPATAARQMGLE
jgi:hypothetical protein